MSASMSRPEPVATGPEPVPVDDALALKAALGGVSSAFASLGRVFFCLDSAFHVLHASSQLDRMLGEGAARSAEGRPVADLLGTEMFGPEGTLRRVLLAGERREGWRSTLAVPGTTPRLVAVTAAPFRPEPGTACDPRVAFVVVLRPAEEEQHSELSPFPGLVGRSPAMRRVFRLVENLELSEATALLTGESGTGKHLVARALHARSLRRGGPFVTVSCASLPAELLESELFGHARGALPGAVRDRPGRVEAAAGGTLLLDEIGELPPPVQAKVLALLSDRRFERKGEVHARTADVRVIAATSVDLRTAVLEGRFDEALYVRLRVVPIEIPALRERREDVEPLAAFLLARVGARQGRALRFSPDVLRVFLEHGWPGNARELENVLEYAVAVCKGQTILPEDLPHELSGPAALPAPASPGTRRRAEGRRDAGDDAQAIDAARIRGALEACRWRRSDAARALGLSRTTLGRRMRALGLE